MNNDATEIFINNHNISYESNKHVFNIVPEHETYIVNVWNIWEYRKQIATLMYRRSFN
jgi:hypothetical protein